MTITQELGMQERLKFIIQCLVDEPKWVKVEEVHCPNGAIIFEVSVAPNDKGKLIGIKGVNAEALRTILNSMATRQLKHAELRII